jgi:hypothetical protein
VEDDRATAKIKQMQQFGSELSLRENVPFQSSGKPKSASEI